MKDKSSKKSIFTEAHYGKWVALSADRKKILDYSDNLKTLTERLSDEKVVYTKAMDPKIAHCF